jgi:hypothetical protein
MVLVLSAVVAMMVMRYDWEQQKQDSRRLFDGDVARTAMQAGRRDHRGIKMRTNVGNKRFT